MRMKKSEREYFPPEAKVNEVIVEHGFTLSNIESLNPEKPEQEW